MFTKDVKNDLQSTWTGTTQLPSFTFITYREHFSLQIGIPPDDGRLGDRNTL